VITITAICSYLLLSCRISVENIELEFSSLYVRIKSLEEKVQGDQELLQQLDPFLQVKQQQLCNTLYTQTHRQKVGSRPLYISKAADSTDNDKSLSVRIKKKKEK